MKRIFSKIILKVIPHHFIRSLKKKFNINYFFFGSSVKNVGSYLVDDNQANYSLYGMEAELGETVCKGFVDCIKDYETHHGLVRKYILCAEDCVIEPLHGWGITNKDKLIFDSISNNSWKESYYPNYFRYKAKRDTAIQMEEIISINILRGGENNYWHFLHDLLGEVTIALKYISRDIPFLISKNLWEKPYFKQALLISSTLANLNWVIRDENYFHIKKAWFIQVLPSSNEQFLNIQDLLQLPRIDKNANRKIFLNRSKKRIRFLSNSKAVEEIAIKYGFEIMDADNFSLQEQIQLFSETKWLVGIHGAGLTNIMFKREGELSILELLPADYLQPHYFWLAKGLGHNYSCLVGSSSEINTSFFIEPKAFEMRLKAMLET